MIVMALILLVAAVYSIVQQNLLYAVLATGVVSLVLSVFFYMLQAPDVAITEATIGIALTTIIFVITIRNTTRDEKKYDEDHINKFKTEEDA
jgi:uncharacterized MnhB-related membrane protein